MIFVLGGGPGLFQVPWGQTKGHRCIAVNNAYRIAPWSEVVWFGDVKWWRWHKDEVLSTGIPIMTCCEHSEVRQQMGRIPQLTCLSRYGDKRFGLSLKHGFISWNSSSGASAINLAVQRGAKRVILLGFDMRRVEGQKNWHSDHRDGPKHNPFYRHLKAFPAIAKDAKDLGVIIENATPNSAIKEFPIVDLRTILDEL